MQMTVRMPDEYTKKLDQLSKRMGLKRSDIIRLALKQFFEEDDRQTHSSPFQKVSHLLGVTQSGIRDLGKRHRDYFITKVPEDLIKKAMTFARHKTKTETVVVALQEYIRKKKIEKILSSEGKLQFEDTWEKSRHARQRLEDDAPFFRNMDQIVKNRQKHSPRVLKSRKR